MVTLDRREFLAGLAAGVAAGAVGADAELLSARGAATGLAAPAFTPLPLGAIRPAGCTNIRITEFPKGV
jgi:hypothetical protein